MSRFQIETKIYVDLASIFLLLVLFPSSDGVNVELYTGYERPPVKLDVIIPVLNVPKFMGYVLLHLADNYMFAYRSVYNINDMEFEKHVLCVGYQNENTEYGLKL